MPARRNPLALVLEHLMADPAATQRSGSQRAPTVGPMLAMSDAATLF